MAQKRTAEEGGTAADASSDGEHGNSEAALSPAKAEPARPREEGEDAAADGSASEEAELHDKSSSLPETNLNSAPAQGVAGNEDEEDDGVEEELDDSSDEPPPPLRASAADYAKAISSRGTDGSPPVKPKNAAPGSGSSSEPPSKKRRSASSALAGFGGAGSSKSGKRPHFQRIWSHDDELAVLRGLDRFIARKRRLPASMADVDTLHGIIRNLLSASVTSVQLSDKVRRLKKKYLTVAARGRRGKDPPFADHHEKMLFQLSKKVWGWKQGTSSAKDVDRQSEEEGSEESNSREGTLALPAVPQKRKRIQKVKTPASTIANGDTNTTAERSDIYPYLWEAVGELSSEHSGGALFKRAFAVLDESKAGAMEEKLKKFRMSELKQQYDKFDLMKETLKTVLDALEKSE